MGWEAGQRIDIVCGHCNNAVSAYIVATSHPEEFVEGLHLRCDICERGSYLEIITLNNQRVGIWPGSKKHREIDSLPKDVKSAYDEARNCFSVSAFTAAELICRKILMHIAVDLGANEGESFASYINHIEKEGYITTPMRPWADLIRKRGNAATHELEAVSEKGANETMEFTMTMLQVVYELPARAKKFTDEPSEE